jgi:hypothetical protein
MVPIEVRSTTKQGWDDLDRLFRKKRRADLKLASRPFELCE